MSGVVIIGPRMGGGMEVNGLAGIDSEYPWRACDAKLTVPREVSIE